MTKSARMPVRQGRGFAGALLPLAIFLLIGFLALTLPDHPDAVTWRAFARLPLELPLLGLCLLVLPRGAARVIAGAATVIAFLLLFLKLADIGVQSAFQRPFNPYLDGKMLVDGWNVLSGSIGRIQAALALCLLLLIFVACLALFRWSMRGLIRLRAPERQRLALLFAGLAVVWMPLAALPPSFPRPVTADARMVADLSGRLALIAGSIADMRTFEADLARPQAPASGAGLFQAVGGRDVILVFVESYGRSAVEDQRYAPLIRPRLAGMQQRLGEAGFAMASGWTLSPTSGGLSWLAHGTFLSGLWIDSQARYDRLVRSDRVSLNRLFQQAGWQTSAIMPAITMAWPEAHYFGYDQVLAAHDLGYRGKPFNWVTMPDQYTLQAFDRLSRQAARPAGRPVMAEIALVSSHAPWTPVPSMIDRALVGDGSVFNEQATSGDPPPVVWADPERVRRQYIATIDYSLQALEDYMLHQGGDAVFIILGDHQPAPIITGKDASRAVPIHVISRDRALIDRFTGQGFGPGMTPAADAPEPRMDAMRDLLIRVFARP